MFAVVYFRVAWLEESCYPLLYFICQVYDRIRYTYTPGVAAKLIEYLLKCKMDMVTVF